MMTAAIYRASGARLLILNYGPFYYFVRGIGKDFSRRYRLFGSASELVLSLSKG